MVAPKNGYSPAPGTGFEPNRRNTALQSHVEFFDTDHDGIIWPSDTYVGFRELNFPIVLAFIAMVFIHGGLSYVTWGTLLPDPFFRLKIKNMHRAKHGSDSEAYNSIGDFDEKRFESIFKMYSSDGSHLTMKEGICMLHGNRNAFDLFGWSAAAFEWSATYYMLWPPRSSKGVEKAQIKAVYDGTIFYKISGKAPNHNKGSG
ncbi:Caleosin-domain-containing protein [Phlegmacium glaucopus]|nr:Caleosin-domain-containing protein [Phlegmacium glaucopus]